MLEAQAATLICLVVVLLVILKKIKDSIWLFFPWRGGVFGYFNFDKVWIEVIVEKIVESFCKRWKIEVVKIGENIIG
jgi:hypothetical protein